MPKFYLATQQALAIVGQRSGKWSVDLHLQGSAAQCVAVDPYHLNQIYCGTFESGLWRSRNGGASWEAVGEGITNEAITSVEVSATERSKEGSVIYAGTEPSAIFRSEDRGDTWVELSALRSLPSAPEWSFPPRPYTSHVRCITTDPLVPGRVFAAIEAGALIRSLDGGQTWEDRQPDGPFDTHTLVMHRLEKDRLYSAAGDGFMRPGNGFVQSDDGGLHWYRPDKGLNHHYLWSVAVNPGNPEAVVISAAAGPRQAHSPEQAESAIYYRHYTNSPWYQAQVGLPDSKGMLASVLAVSPSEPGVFYAANNLGVFRSTNNGSTWEESKIPWPDGFTLGRVNDLVVSPE